jgi:hypothetical protein
VSDVTGLSTQFDEHELQKSMILQEANHRLAQAAETSEPKAGNIVDRVKDELHRTIQAKRKLLEKNFINFRFDEFKKEQLMAKLQLEEDERERGNSGINPYMVPTMTKGRDQGMWKSIQVYTPKQIPKFMSKQLSPKIGV